MRLEEGNSTTAKPQLDSKANSVLTWTKASALHVPPQSSSLISSDKSAKLTFPMENGHIPSRTVASSQTVTGTSRPLSALCKHKSKGFGSDPTKRDSKSGNMLCSGRLWIFFVLGSVLFIIGVITIGLYFNIGELTTTLEYAEVLPTYVPAVAMIVSGCCVFLLFWKRLKILVVVAIVACVTTALLNTIAATLTGTHVIQVVQTLSQCRYYSSRRVCHCTSPYKRSKLDLTYTENTADFMTYIFEGADNCESIHNTLLQLIYGLCGGYVAGVLFCVVAAILAGVALRSEKSQENLQKDAYEEVYTVSGGSSIASDSDNEQPLHQVAPPPPPQQRTASMERKPPNTTLRRSHSLTQSREPRLEESTDNLLTDTSIESSAAAARVRQKRRRHKRAMTLHNLDSKQLMLILSLQMRYLQESENLRDQQNQTPFPTGRQAPNPNRSRTPNPQSERSRSVPLNHSMVYQNAMRRTPNPDQNVTRVQRAPPSYEPSFVQDSGGQVMPNTRLDANPSPQGNIQDMPRYVSLPKLPRRSQTAQATGVTHARSRTTSPRIPSSTSDPNIIEHLSPDSTASKTNMLVQRHGQMQKSPPGQDYLPSHRHGNQPVPGRAHVLQSYPTRIKTSDGNYAQISSYHRSRTPSASSMTSNPGMRPLPPVRSVSCENTLQRSRETYHQREPHPQQPSNYAEVTYASRSPGATVGGAASREEDLYARPSKSPQILLNDTYVDLYPVQENSRRPSQRSLPPPPVSVSAPAPPPPPYPAFFPPVTELPQRGERPAAPRDRLDGTRLPARVDPYEAAYDQMGAARSRTPGQSSQTYGNPQGSRRYPPHPPQGEPSSQYPTHLSQAVYDTSGARQQQQQRQLLREQNLVGAVSSPNVFRPIDSTAHGRQSPPVRERPSQQGALVLHNSDEDSDGEFMETVI